MSTVDRYRLEPVREVRTRDERVRRGDVATAVGEVRATAAQVAAVERRVAELRAAIGRERASARDPGSSAVELARRDRFLARLRRDLDTALGEELRARAAHAGRLGQLDEAQARLVRARGERQVIERHFERWRAEQRKLAERREE